MSGTCMSLEKAVLMQLNRTQVRFLQYGEIVGAIVQSVRRYQGTAVAKAHTQAKLAGSRPFFRAHLCLLENSHPRHGKTY